MSLILKFETEQDRESFLELVRHDRPELLSQLSPNPLFPHLYAQTNPDSDAWLRDRIGRFGQAFDDLKFRTFAT